MQQKKFPWPENKRCAISLTFDDSLISQINNGVPLFEKHNIKVTFFISPQHLKRRLVNWKEIVQNGHEIGNHTMTHPCTINYPFSRNNALENYTLGHIEEDINNANEYILKTLGISPNNFAYPCGQKFIGRGINTKSYVPLIAKKFLTGRGFFDESPNDPWLCDFSQLLGMECDGKSFEELKTLILFSAQLGFWLILVGHNINKDGLQTTFTSSLEKLLKYAQDPINGIWINTINVIAKYILQIRQGSN